MHDKPTEATTRPEIGLKLHSDPSDKPGKKGSSAKTVVLLLLVAVLAGGFFLWRSTRKPQNAAAAGRNRNNGDFNANQRVPVVVSAALRRDLPIYLDGLGSVQAFYTVTLKSRVDGQMMDVRFKEGQDVRSGDLLAIIDPRPYQVALAQAQANLAKDKAQLADAKLNAERYQQLIKDGVIPQQQYDTQVALANQLQGAVDSDQAQIDSAKLNIDYSQITSPIDGRVGLRLVDPGNIVHAADTNGLLVITQMEPIAVVFTLPEDSLQSVNERMRSGATLEVIALSRDNGMQIAKGTLLTIDNEIDQTTGTFKLKAVFDNKDRALWPNQFVNARLLIDTKRGATIVPAAAVQHGDSGTFIYRINPSDNSAEVVPVTVGITEDNISSIDSGISPNDMVVTDGQERLRAGVRVDARVDTRPIGDAAPAVSAAGGTASQGAPPAASGASPAGSQSFLGSNSNANGNNKKNAERRNRQDYGSGDKNRRDQK